jgi:hypothetical protein
MFRYKQNSDGSFVLPLEVEIDFIGGGRAKLYGESAKHFLAATSSCTSDDGHFAVASPIPFRYPRRNKKDQGGCPGPVLAVTDCRRCRWGHPAIGTVEGRPTLGFSMTGRLGPAISKLSTHS